MLICRNGDSYQLTYSNEDGASLPSTDYFLTLSSGEESWFQEWLERHGSIMVNLGVDQRLLDLWKQVSLEQRRANDAHPVLLDYLARCFLLHLERLMENGNKGQSPHEYATANGIREYILLHAAMKPTLQQICASVGLSVSRASQIFKKIFKQSINDYAIEVRLSMARERMAAGEMSLEEIAYLCGFSTYPYFNRAFRTRYGITPSAYAKDLAEASIRQSVVGK